MTAFPECQYISPVSRDWFCIAVVTEVNVVFSWVPRALTVAENIAFFPSVFGPWGQTYERLREQACDAAMWADEAFIVRAKRFQAPIANATGKRGFG